MLNVLLVIHLLACIALVVLVMLQRSEGGALGMGGGGAGGGLISGRGVANALVKTTMALAAIFFVTSLTLTRLNTEDARAPSDVELELRDREGDIFDPLAPAATPGAPAAAAAPGPPPVIDPLAPVVSPLTPAPAAPSPAGPPPVAGTP
ncbi:MAG: preprotein translocase subunit SecG, partial [Alphaproteobacteria bacterium]|nr:preprotein translocase subunit SecG [Alphaproteobacteria bacterium]